MSFGKQLGITALLILALVFSANAASVLGFDWARHVSEIYQYVASTEWTHWAALAIGALVLAARTAFKSRGKGRGLKPLSPSLIALAVLLAATSTAALTIWLYRIATSGPMPPNPSVQIDAIRTGLGAAAGAGGAIALILAARRQWSTEVSSRESIRDADEKRNLDLYNKAVEQLGTTTPSIQLGALFSLERLGQENESYRQTVVSLLASYMRNPTSFTGQAVNVALKTESRVAKRRRTLRPADRRRDPVFSAAQEIIRKHLDRAEEDLSDNYWPGLNLNLAGVTFYEADFSDLSVEVADFSDCRFLSRARFNNMRAFVGDFSGARFDLRCNFTGSALHNARFADADFMGEARFDETEFYGDADFSGAKFHSLSSFKGVVFHVPTMVAIVGVAIGRLSDQLLKSPRVHALFSSFVERHLTGSASTANFEHATFRGSVDFTDAISRRPFNLVHVAFHGPLNLSDSLLYSAQLHDAKIAKSAAELTVWGSVLRHRGPQLDEDQAWRFLEWGYFPLSQESAGEARTAS